MHTEKLHQISKEIRSRISDGNPIKIVKGSVPHFVPNPYDKSDKQPKIDIKNLNQILKIDVERQICIAEPGVTFSDLVAATLPHGLIPYTVPELKEITLGGAISGCSLESMSYRYGGFHDSCLEYEIITGTGKILRCSPEEHPDIFNMIHGSYGTLGILTKVMFKLLPAKPYVHMVYRTFSDFDSYWSFMKDHCDRGDVDFIDGIIHSPTSLVACLGTMVDEAPNVSSYQWLNIYYKSTLTKREDYLSTSDYLFRYDTECHWLTKTVPLMETKPARLALGKMVLGSTNLIKWSKRLKNIMKIKRRPEVVVDVFIPEKRIKDFYEWYIEYYQFYPLWIVPYRAPEIYPWINREYAKGMSDGFFVDCAVYGKKNNDRNVDYSETLEKKTIELGGIKTLISRNHFTKEEFWNVYDRDNYEAVKKQTDPKGLFKDLFEKFRPENYT